jgi:hypothetical protein
MNVLGKVFIVVVFILSVMFMSFAVIVYTTHKNWRELVVAPNTGLQAQLQQAQARSQQLQLQHDRLVERLQAEKRAEEEQVAKLETERRLLMDMNAQIQADLDQRRQQERAHIAAIESTQRNNEDLSNQVTNLAQQKRDGELARDTQFAAMLAATEQRNQLVGQLESTTQRNMDLAKKVGDMTAVMRANSIDPGTDPNSVVQTVDGVVLAVRRAGGVQLVEVSIGADDDLKPGHTVEVFRGGKYLGRLDILETSPDKAVGQVDRRFQLGQIQEGDRVATRLD